VYVYANVHVHAYAYVCIMYICICTNTASPVHAHVHVFCMCRYVWRGRGVRSTREELGQLHTRTEMWWQHVGGLNVGAHVSRTWSCLRTCWLVDETQQTLKVLHLYTYLMKQRNPNGLAPGYLLGGKKSPACMSDLVFCAPLSLICVRGWSLYRVHTHICIIIYIYTYI